MHQSTQHIVHFYFPQTFTMYIFSHTLYTSFSIIKQLDSSYILKCFFYKVYFKTVSITAKLNPHDASTVQSRLKELEAAYSMNNMFELSLRQDVKHWGLQASIAGL